MKQDNPPPSTSAPPAFLSPSACGVSERAQHFLRVLIDRYIRDGQPVGSRALARDSGLDLSPATVRNIMADLEEAGFIISPHTSAGRVPTVAGYRFFVDSLLLLKPVEEQSVLRVKEELGMEGNPQALMSSASKLLSELTHLAGVVMVPKRAQILIRQLEFIPLSATRVLTILVTQNGEIINRVIETSRPFERHELEQAGNYLTQNFAGQGLSAMRARLLEEMEDARRSLNTLMSQVLEMADAAWGEAGESSDFVMAGQTNLMDFDELTPMTRLRELFDAFTEKQEILHLLDRSMEADGIQIFIGEESGYHPFENCSVITAPYKVDHEVIGVLGVIGPTRVPYDRVIPIVDVTARLFGAALQSRP